MTGPYSSTFLNRQEVARRGKRNCRTFTIYGQIIRQSERRKRGQTREESQSENPAKAGPQEFITSFGVGKRAPSDQNDGVHP